MSSSQGKSTPPTSSFETKEILYRPKQRVLIMQGGGALGAYEAGAFRAFYDWLNMQTDENSNIYDAIAGTSIGAINAAIIINYVIRNRRNAEKEGREISAKAAWQGAAEELEDFWKNQLAFDPFFSKMFIPLWNPDLMKAFFPNIASAEAARRYFGTREGMLFGVPGVFSSSQPIFDYTYFDFFYNIWWRSDNERLKNSLKKYIDFPIKTNADKNEPRLLTITSDVVTSYVVSFDSYNDSSKVAPYDDTISSLNLDGKQVRKITGHRKGDGDYYEGEQEFTLNYKQGLMPEHVMASASVPIGYDYQWVPLNYDYNNPMNNTISSNNRAFWDGGILSNTPLREFLVRHYYFWTGRLDRNGKLRKNIWATSEETTAKITEGGLSQKKDPDLVPNLDVYIVDLWPDKIDEKYLPTTFDITKARMSDIMMGDKTQYDQVVTEGITDYSNLAKEIRAEAIDWASAIAKDKAEELRKRIDDILDRYTNLSRSSEGRNKFKDLLLGQFDVERVFRVRRTAEIDAISNMMMDFTQGTISQMWKRGRDDAVKEILRHTLSVLGLNMAENTAQEYKDELQPLKALLLEASDLLNNTNSNTHYQDAILKLEEFVRLRDEFLKKQQQYIFPKIGNGEDKQENPKIKEMKKLLGSLA